MLHEGGGENSIWWCRCWRLLQLSHELRKLHFVQIGFLKNPASHLERSPSIHSYGYGSSCDSPSCLASFPRNSNSFMQHAG